MWSSKAKQKSKDTNRLRRISALSKMEYTKGERQLYCGSGEYWFGEYWFVDIITKPNRANITVGRFRKKEDALLDAAAPLLYEALKAFIKAEDEGFEILSYGRSQNARKALALAEAK